MRLILASRSPRRAELLARAGYHFEVDAADVDESVLAGEPADSYVTRLAVEKGRVLSARLHSEVVLAADTSVVVDGAVFGKPSDGADGARMLERLSGRSHEVLTGIALWHGGTVRSALARTVVTFAPISAAEVAWYVASGEGLDKAGGYAIQGMASRFVERIDGSYTNVVGLPVSVVSRLLQRVAPPGAFDRAPDSSTGMSHMFR